MKLNCDKIVSLIDPTERISFTELIKCEIGEDGHAILWGWTLSPSVPTGWMKDYRYADITDTEYHGGYLGWSQTLVHIKTIGEVTPKSEPIPECTEGDKKPGYICSGGKWVPYTPKETIEIIKQPLPNTIEFQELIPGIKPPRVPILIPGLEKIPLMPGWIIRDPEGNVINAGIRIPILTWETAQPPDEPPGEPPEEHPVMPILPDIPVPVDALEEEEMEL